MTDNPFARLWSLGYRRLVPIIPPGAPVSERSSLFKRLQRGDDARGKMPGVQWPDGTWSGFDFTQHESIETDLVRWHAMGAGVGVKTGRGLALIDADTLNPEHAAAIRRVIETRLGVLPIRIGKPPKAGYLVRVAGVFQYARVEFGQRDDKGRLRDRVEILYEGRQFVAIGTHPLTQKPYQWPDGVPALADVPEVSAEALYDLLAALKDVLPAASDVVREGAATEINQASLIGDPDTVRRAVAAIPNTSDLFPTRESYVTMGYAIKAALPGHDAEAFELFADWCARWTDGTNEPDIVEAEWRRLKAPYRIGAGWLYDLAREHGGGRFTCADEAVKWLEERPAPPLFPDTDWPAGNLPNAFESPGPSPARGLYEVLSIGELYSMPDPAFLIDRHIPAQSVGFIYGDPGTGKSFVALDAALHVAFGLASWHGDEIRAKPNARVIYIAGEGAAGFKTRVSAWCAKHGVAEPSTGRFGLVFQSINFMSPDDVKRLVTTLRTLYAGDVALVVVDTVSRAMPGADENLQKEMTLFVKACDVIRDAFKCAVLGVHHAGKSGDMRGSTVLRGAGDYVFKLERKQGAAVGRLACEKQKDAPDGWADSYRFDTVMLGEDARGRPLSSLVPFRCDATGLGGGSGTGGVEMSPDVSARVLEAMREAWDAGEPWGRTYHAGERWACRRMVQDYGLLMDEAERVVETWLAVGVVREDLASKKSKRKGLYVALSGVTWGEENVLD